MLDLILWIGEFKVHWKYTSITIKPTGKCTCISNMGSDAYDCPPEMCTRVLSMGGFNKIKDSFNISEI